MAYQKDFNNRSNLAVFTKRFCRNRVQKGSTLIDGQTHSPAYKNIPSVLSWWLI